MELRLHDYGVVLLTETWLTSENELRPLLGIVSNRYLGIRCDRLSKKGGGILLLVKNSLWYTEVFSESVANSYEILVCKRI